jgi:hypothetical protein
VGHLTLDFRVYQPPHGMEDFYRPGEATTLSPFAASGSMIAHTLIITPVVDAGLLVISESNIAGVRLALVRYGTQQSYGRFFRNWAELLAELARSKIMRPQELAVAQSSILRGIQWVSPSPVPVTERQITSLKLRA